MKDRVTIILRIKAKNLETDIDIPLDITAFELLTSINIAYALGIDTTDASKCYLRAESPSALLRGSKTLREYGIRDGSEINI
jgi:uncharacterized ubiquitin-like protein YukD